MIRQHMNTINELCTCPIGDLGLQVHFPMCGDPGWDAEDAAEVNA